MLDYNVIEASMAISGPAKVAKFTTPASLDKLW